MANKFGIRFGVFGSDRVGFRFGGAQIGFRLSNDTLVSESVVIGQFGVRLGRVL